MAIPDPDNTGRDGDYFRFPYATIESIFPTGDRDLLLVDDNNFPFSNGRSFTQGARRATAWPRGQLCCGVTGQGLVVRLGPEGVARARQEAHVRPLVLGGKEVGAFAVIEPEGYADDDALARWVFRAVAVVEGPAAPDLPG
jgi:hypothetical protein